MEGIGYETDDYVEWHTSSEPEYLKTLTRESNLRLVNGRMCSGHLQGRLLKILTQLYSPKRVLELGTFTGYSALCIAEGLPEDGILITVEVDDELEDFIRRQLEKSPYGARIELRIGDALEECRGLESESIDMIFMDADKRQYPAYFRECRRILRPGGLIVADNTLWSGHVADPAYANDPQTRGVSEFNDMVVQDPEFETVILPIRDGLSLIRKKDKTE